MCAFQIVYNELMPEIGKLSIIDLITPTIASHRQRCGWKEGEMWHSAATKLKKVSSRRRD